MNYIIVALLIIVIILLFFNLFKPNDKKWREYYKLQIENKSEISKDLLAQTNIMKEYFDQKLYNMYKENKELEVKLLQIINENNKNINLSVEQKITASLAKTNESYLSLIQRLTRIDEAQKNIEKLGYDVSSLKNVLTDKKTRGIFGEMTLKQVIYNVFGDSNIYKMQYKLENGYIADCVIHTNSNISDIFIDSKFPLENYRRLCDAMGEEKKFYEKEFKKDLRKHIDTIKEKYVITTNNHAILFIPAEAIFAYTNAYASDMIEYALKQNIWIASPTTLLALLSTVLVVMENDNRNKYAKIISDELSKLSIEFDRYFERFNRLKNNIETLSKTASDIYITSNKIQNRFKQINSGNKNLIENDDIERDV